MTQQTFQKIALMARQNVPGVRDTLKALISQLLQYDCDVMLESSITSMLPSLPLPVVTHETLKNQADLIIVVGGDGSLITAAHVAINSRIPVLGINRGRLGFLTDICPHRLEEIELILNGTYQQEERFALSAGIIRNHHSIGQQQIALNDVVLLPDNMARMVEFDVSVDDKHVCHHRADGIIVATPTGSTAYALSGGGPILHPNLSAVVLVPMFPHTLSSRPIVVSDQSTIKITIDSSNEFSPCVSCDGQNRQTLQPGDELVITKNPEKLKLIHPNDYCYFDTLQEKLNWEKQAHRT